MLLYSFDGAQNPFQNTKCQLLVNVSSPICLLPHIGASLGVHAHRSVQHRTQFYVLGCSACPDRYASHYRRVTVLFAVGTVVRYHSAQSSSSNCIRLAFLSSRVLRSPLNICHNPALLVTHFCASPPCADILRTVYRRIDQ